jgi:hypothetical protein
MSAPRSIPRQALRFLLGHWLHFLLLGIFGVVGVTTLHEGAHAMGVWLQGGELLEFVVMGDEESWGHVRYQFAPGAQYSARLISLAPAIGALGALMVGLVAALFGPRRDGHLAKAVWFWLCMMPAGELGFMGLGYFTVGARCDLFYALGPITWPLRLAGLAMGCSVVALLYGLQRRLFDDLALGQGAFALLGGLAVVGLCGVLLI